MITDKIQKLRFSLKEVVSFNIIYGLDTKPSNILDSFKSDENIVFLELVKIQPALYNVSYTNKPHERKTRGLIEGLKEFDLERGAILTKNYASKK